MKDNNRKPPDRRAIIEEAPFAYYDSEYPDRVAQLAKDLIVARDKYLGAYVAWHECALGAGLDPETECDIMRGIMEDMIKRAMEPE